jgi:SpoVK/Ycf46/Vps4 family AAA+-type ATPase
MNRGEFCALIGPSGSGKTMVAHATGAEGGVPTIGFDVNAMKGMYQGQSGGQFRSALEIVRSVGQGNVMALATCNSFGSISPELKRRFKTGTFFFDLPTKKERMLIWELCIKKFFISDTKIPADENWTGAEISQCCEVAYRLNCSLEEAAQYVVPVAESGAQALEALRKQASGCFTDASKVGRYKYEQSVMTTPRRRMI